MADSEILLADGQHRPIRLATDETAGLHTLKTAGAAAAGGIQTGTFTDRTKTTVATTSTQLMAANANRKKLVIQAPQTAGVWLNMVGGVASVAGDGCLFLAAGQMLTSDEFCTTAEIRYFCATASLKLVALEA